MKINNSKKFNQFFDKSSNRNIKHLVLHDIEAETFELAIEELKKHEVSAHYIINSNGEIFQLVAEEDIAYHAGYSHWRGEDGLNKSSIGIEFYNPNPAKKEFTDLQIESGIVLCKQIIKRHNIKAENVVGHSDIAYFKESGLLNRKQDPSHLFPWKKLADNGVGVWCDIKISGKLGDKNEKVRNLKQDLNDFGYKVDNLNNEFDDQLESICVVFRRRFCQ